MGGLTYNKGSVYNSRRIVWTKSDIFWTHKISSDVLNNNEWDISELCQHWESEEFY